MNSPYARAVARSRRPQGLAAVALCLAVAISSHELRVDAADRAVASTSAKYQFDTTISREVLENYLARSITMEPGN
jgi:hypothetical protein